MSTPTSPFTKSLTSFARGPTLSTLIKSRAIVPMTLALARTPPQQRMVQQTSTRQSSTWIETILQTSGATSSAQSTSHQPCTSCRTEQATSELWSSFLSKKHGIRACTRLRTRFARIWCSSAATAFLSEKSTDVSQQTTNPRQLRWCSSSPNSTTISTFMTRRKSGATSTTSSFWTS